MSQPDPTPTAPTPAVAVMLIPMRDGAEGLEVFCVESGPPESPDGRALTFPGGRVERGDLGEDWSHVALPVHPRTAEFAATPAQQRALVIAACRRALEEAAILPVNGALTHSVAVGLRRTLAGSADAFRSALDARDLRLDLASVVPCGRWVTPPTEPRRFDTRCFLARTPSGQDGLVEDGEVSRRWATPGAILARSEQGELALDPPVQAMLQTLSQCQDVESALARAASLPLTAVEPGAAATA